MNCPYDDRTEPETPQPMNGVPKGYKQTEVGVIPEDWSVKRVGDLGTVVRGGSPRPAGDPRYFNGSFIPWLTVAALTNISEHQLDVRETVGFLMEEGSKRSRILNHQTLIIANSGATLGVAKLLQLRCCANDGIAALIGQTSGDKAFISYYLNTQTKRLREVVATGNGQPNLNTRLIGNITVPFPHESEQSAIATTLSDVDALIATLDQLIAKKRDLKQAALQELLTGRRRLPGFSRGWAQKQLGELCAMRSGEAITSSRIDAFSRYPCYGGNGLRGFTARFTHEGRHSLIGRQGALCGNVFAVRGRFFASEHAVVVTAFADTDIAWLTYVLGQMNLNQYSESSAQPGLSVAKIMKLTIATPESKAEQTAIAAVLSDMDAEIAALEARRDKTKSLKQGMMQELLTGRIRLV